MTSRRTELTISGRTESVLELNAADLKELLPLLGDRKLVQKLISSYKSTVREHNRVTTKPLLLACSPPTTPGTHAGCAYWLSMDFFLHPGKIFEKDNGDNKRRLLADTKTANRSDGLPYISAYGVSQGRMKVREVAGI